MDRWREEEISEYPDVSEMHAVPIHTVCPGSLCDICCDSDED